jgi:hypothetical protein
MKAKTKRGQVKLKALQREKPSTLSKIQDGSS